LIFVLGIKLIIRRMSTRVVVLREVESRMQFLVAGDASSFRIAAKNATLLKNNLQELMNDTSFDV
jgi:hypothetical protein